MIQTNQICKVFSRIERQGLKEVKNEFYAVDHISIKAVPGEILGILGPNGAGKTTLLRMMGNLMVPTEGKVQIFDKDGVEIQEEILRKRQIGYLSGNTKLYHRFSIREILEILGQVYGLNKEESRERIDEIIEILSLQSFVDNRLEKLSTGQMQRANIARCLIHSPQIYIFDEPTLGLDIISSEAILQFMKQEKKQGKTILYSTHYMEEAQYLCDHIVMVANGKVVAEGTPEELMTKSGTTNLRDTFYQIIRQQGEPNEYENH